MKKNETATIVGIRLREARQSLNFSQTQLGAAFGLEPEAAAMRISRYEAGIHEPPFEIVAKLADALSVPTAYFYCVDNDLAKLLKHWNQLREDERSRIMAILSELDA